MTLKQQVKYLEDNYYGRFKMVKEEESRKLIVSKYVPSRGNLFVNKVNQRVVSRLKALIKI